jgi:hypothetical protein
MSESRPASAESEAKSGAESPIQRWRRVSKRVGFQKNWTKECIIKVLNDSEGETLEGKDSQRIPFNANRKKTIFCLLKQFRFLNCLLLPVLVHSFYI